MPTSDLPTGRQLWGRHFWVQSKAPQHSRDPYNQTYSESKGKYKDTDRLNETLQVLFSRNIGDIFVCHCIYRQSYNNCLRNDHSEPWINKASFSAVSAVFYWWFFSRGEQRRRKRFWPAVPHLTTLRGQARRFLSLSKIIIIKIKTNRKRFWLFFLLTILSSPTSIQSIVLALYLWCVDMEGIHTS